MEVHGDTKKLQIIVIQNLKFALYCITMVCVSRCSLKSVDMSAIALGLGDMSNIAPSPSGYPDITPRPRGPCGFTATGRPPARGDIRVTLGLGGDIRHIPSSSCDILYISI